MIAYLHLLEEAAKRDHRKLGKELGLFVIKEEGPGFPFFLPKGMALRNELENFWREVHHEFDYEEIRTPIILINNCGKHLVTGSITVKICTLQSLMMKNMQLNQ